MRIAMVTPVVGDAYGQERVVRDSTLLLREAGHEVFILGDYVRGSVPPCDGVTLVPSLSKINLFSRHFGGKKLKEQALHALERFNPDVVHLVDQFDASFQTALCDSYPVVFTSHLFSPTCPSSTRLTQQGTFCPERSGWACLSHHSEYQCLAQFKTPLHRAHAVHDYLERRESLRKVRSVIAISRFVADLLHKDGWAFAPIEVVYNPVAVNILEERPTRLSPPLIVCAARLEAYKGVHVLIQALKKMEQLAWTTWICGDGPEKERLIDLVRTLGLSHRVSFMGRVSFETMAQTLKTASIFVQPNQGPEPFGLAAAEASAQGIPVVAANVPALNEIVRHEETGLLFPAGDSDVLARSLELLLGDEAKRKRFGLAGHARVKTWFSPKKHLEGTLSVYRKALGAQADLGEGKGESSVLGI